MTPRRVELHKHQHGVEHAVAPAECHCSAACQEAEAGLQRRQVGAYEGGDAGAWALWAVRQDDAVLRGWAGRELAEVQGGASVRSVR